MCAAHAPDRNSIDARRGVFETMLVRDGRAVEVGPHLARLRASVGQLYEEPAPGELERLVADGARGLTLGRLRLTVAPNGGSGLVAAVRTAAVEAAAVFPGWSRAVELAPLVVDGGLGVHKWADRTLLERAETSAGGALALVIDGDGTVLEASRASVFAVEGSAIVTPPADGRILEGITRRRVLELVPVREEPISLERLLAADEVFLTGSVRGVEPVRACGERAWEEGERAREVARRLQRHWEESP
jgi:para-aminobenzoate synthetase/4-amino-4-deoxychorismate lyase